jgi:inner membrane transporter RhtA
MTAGSWRSRLGPLLLLLVAMGCFPLGAALAADSLFPAVGASGAAALRLALAAPILLVAARAWRLRLTASSWRHVLRYGVVLGAMNLCFYLAIRTLPLGVAVAIEFTGPLSVALWHSRRPLDYVWVVLAVLGLALLLPLGEHAAHVDPVGVMFAFGAALSWALYIVWGRQAGLAAGEGTVALGMAVGALVVLPFGGAAAMGVLQSPMLLAMAVAVALLSNVLPYTLEMRALTRLPARVFGVSMSLEPALAAIVGWMWLSEQLVPLQVLAIVAIITASAGAALTARAS